MARPRDLTHREILLENIRIQHAAVEEAKYWLNETRVELALKEELAVIEKAKATIEDINAKAAAAPGKLERAQRTLKKALIALKEYENRGKIAQLKRLASELGVNVVNDILKK